MLPTTARVRRSSEFAAALKDGTRAKRGAVVVHVGRQDTGRREPRAGFIVSKAVGGAVVRNKVKRRLRHLIAARLTTLDPGTDIVVRALPFAASRSWSRLEADVDQALRSAIKARRAS